MEFLKINYTVLIICLLQLSSRCLCQSKWSITDVFQDGKYNLTRHVDMDKRTIQFHAVVETVGYVGLGLSPNGGMTGADIFIGGVKDGKSYFGDYHAFNNSRPIEDGQNDWNLDAFSETATHTSLTFSRNLDTCDMHDVAITDDGLSIIWAYGTTDDIQFHGANKGTIRVNLLDPPMPSEDTSTFTTWKVLVNEVMPTQDTSYRCTVHTHDPMQATRHLVGFAASIEGPLALEHTHHFIFRKCVVTAENLPEFQKYVDQPSIECYSKSTSDVHPLHEACQYPLFVWAKGGGPTMLPENVGLPMAEKPTETEYYMLEIHYDNPRKTEGLQFETGLEIYHTGELRDKEAGVFMIGHSVWWVHTIPPNTENFKTVGHCPGECTQAALPAGGINAFNVLLHSHLSGRKLKLRHFRGNKELPWLASDQNYDFDFQQNRPLRKEIKIERGDQLSYECITDTTWKNGEITIGDLGTEDEMCEAFVMYYPRIDMDNCGSTYPPMDLLENFGIKNMTENPVGNNNPIISDPPNLAGRNYTDYMTHGFTWTAAKIEEFQQKVLKTDHEYYCGSSLNPDFERYGHTNYPDDVEPYEEEDTCNAAFSLIRNQFTLLMTLTVVGLLPVTNIFQQ